MSKTIALPHLQQAAILSLITILFWAISNVFLRYCVIELNCNQFAIACSNVLFSGLAMILLGNHKINVRQIIFNYQTWLFGALQIFRNLFMIMAFVYISSTQANLLSNIEIVFSVLFAWFLFGRRPGEIDYFAMVFIIVGCFILVAGLPLDIMVKAMLFVAISSFLNVLRTIIAEVHHDNKASMSFKDRLSMTGWVLFVSGVAFIAVAMVFSWLLTLLPHHFSQMLPFLQSIPEPQEYIAFNNITCGLINGICFYAISMYCYLYAVSLSNTEYFMMFRSTQAIFTYGVEIVVSMFTTLPFMALNLNDWLAAVTIILSSGCMVLMRMPKGERLKKLINET